MTATQRRYHEQVAEDVVALTGPALLRAVRAIENPKILRRIFRLETEMSGGRPRRVMVRAIESRRAQLKRLRLRTCKACGCTDRHGCPGGCGWAEEDLCTQCEKG